MLSDQDPLHQPKGTFILFRPFVAFWHWMFPPTVAHQDRQTRTAKVVAVVTIITLLLGAAAFVLYNAKPWYRAYRSFRSDRIVNEALKYEADKNIADAVKSATQAYFADPDNPNAIRLIARYYTLSNQPSASALWRRLRAVTTLTDSDKILEVRALANDNQNVSTLEEIKNLLLDTQPTQELVDTADMVLQKLGQRKELISILKTYVERKPDDLSVRLLLAVRQQQLGDILDQAEGESALWQIAESPEQPAIGAITVLDSKEGLSDSEKEKLVKLIQAHPLATENEKVIALRRTVELDPLGKPDLVDRAIAERMEMDKEKITPFALWLSKEAQKDDLYANKLLLLLPEERVYDTPTLLDCHLNALTKLKLYDALTRILKNPRTRLTVAERSFRLAHLAYVTQKPWDEVNSLLLDTLSSTQGSARPELMLQLARYAEERGHLMVAEQAYQSGTTMQKLERDSFDGLLRLTYRNGNSKGFMEAAEETARRWPDNQVYLERAIYAALLAGIGMETAVPQAQRLLEQQPDDSLRKLIMALACTRQMDTVQASRHLNGINLSNLSPGQAGVLCGILQSAGYNSKAADILSQFPKDVVMLPEEALFLERARKQLPY